MMSTRVIAALAVAANKRVAISSRRIGSFYLKRVDSLEIQVVSEFDTVAAIPQGGIAKWRRPEKIGTGSAASTSN
jgi:hypothetical protein